MVVYLAVPEHRVGGRNVAEGLDGGARFRSEVVLRRDENTGLAEKPIRVARSNLRLLAEGESHAGSVTLPVARLLRGAGGAPELDTTFIPPLVDIAASPRLSTLVRRLLELLTARSAALAGMRRQRRGGVAEFGVSDVANFWLLYTVNSQLPRFRHFLESGRGHPAALYGAMTELAGALTASFSTNLQPADLPAYDHLDLTGCFERLDDQVRSLLDTAVPAQHVSLPLRSTETSVHAVALDQDRYLEATGMYLAVAARNRSEELVRRVPQLLKVSSADRIEQLIRRALPGVELTHTADPPSAIPVRLDRQYFALERSGEDWDAVRRSRHLAVYVPGDLEDPHLELVILLPPEGA
jgi:type VI secretion system protein ImpJ